MTEPSARPSGRGAAPPRPLHWLHLPWLVVAFLVFTSCGGGSKETRPTQPPATTYEAHLSAPTESEADAHANELAQAIVHDVYVAEACHYDNPGCDPTAFQRIRDTTDRWKATSHCTLQEIRVGAGAEKTSDKLENSGNARAALFRDTGAGIEAAVVIIPTEPGVVLLVPPGVPATFFGIVLVSDCSAHPKPGLGDDGH